jgi:predicted amidohydrolase YtcJ
LYNYLLQSHISPLPIPRASKTTVAHYSATNKPINPEQALTIEEAMYAHTMGGAYTDFAEDKKGSLEPGKFADLVVWSDDFYTVDPVDIINVNAEMTMIDGQVVHGG